MSLRLIVWDATNTIGYRKRSDAGTAGVELGLAPAWWAGAKLHGLLRGRTPHRARGVASWEEAFRFALETADETGLPIAELQAWGHGGWGFMDIGDSRLSTRAFDSLSTLLDELRARMTPEGQLWLRCCSAFGGREGRRLATALSARIDRRVVGHTYVIGVRQSGTHSIMPGGQVSWPLEEGVEMRDGEPVRAKGSGFFEPNTLSCLRLDLPTGW